MRRFPALPTAREWAWLLAFAVSYFFAARLGHVLTPQPRHFATFWPPGGLILAALLVCRRSLVPWIAVAALPPSLASNLGIGVPPSMSVLFFASDIAAAITVAVAIRRIVGGRPSMSVLSNVLLFVVGCAAVAALAALGGAAILAAFGSPFGTSFRLWWLGDALGALIVGSFVLAWAERDERSQGSVARRSLEAAALLLFALASTWALFSSSTAHHLRTEMVMVPCLLWAAVRFGPRGATALGMLVSVGSVYGAHEGLGPFARVSDVDERTAAVQFFLAIVTITQLVLTATVAERRKSAEALRRSQEQLLRSEKLEGIGRLAGGIAHDFNNILTIINTYADLVAAAVTDPAIRSDVEEIRRAGDRAGALTRNLLALGRRTVVQPQVLDMGRVLAGMEKLLRGALGERIALSIRGDPGPAAVTIDPSQLEQVIMTLALNARDAMPEGGDLTLTVSIVVERHGPTPVPAGEWVVLAVTDSGVGMTDEVRSHLFEPYFTTKDKDRGTGLGLASLFATVKGAGGHVTASSRLGKGSTFDVYLPRSREQPAPTRTTSAPAARHDGGARTVLLVEDQAGVRALVVRTLSNHGYDVLEASNGPDAIVLFERHRSEIALLVTDVVMPGMSGKSVVEQLRRARPDLPALLISGHAYDVLGADANMGDGCAFLPKPFSEASLLAAVRGLLEASPGEARQASGPT